MRVHKSFFFKVYAQLKNHMHLTNFYWLRNALRMKSAMFTNVKF